MAAKGTLTVRIVGDARSFAQAMKSSEQRVERFGRNLERTGKTLTRNLTLPLAAVGVAAVKAASDQEQAFGAIESVLGETSQELKDFGDQAAESYGLSREQVARLGAVTAAQLKSFGFSNEQAAETVITLQKRAADMAATFGGPVDDAVSAISALLRGERDPIERYGVAIKQSDVNARLAAEGLDGLTGQARKTAEAQAQLALLMEQTADASGAFGREIDTAAGATAIAQAEIKNAAADLGETLLPMAAEAAGAVADLASAFSELPEPVQTAVVQVGLFAAAAGPAAVAAGKLIKGVKAANTAFFAMSNASLAATGAVGVLAAAYVAYVKHQTEVRQEVDNLVESFDEATGAVTAHTDAVITDQLAQRGAIDAANKLGISTRDLVDATMGNLQAQQRIDTVLKDVNRRYRESTTGMGEADEGIGDLVGAAFELTAALDVQSDRVGTATDEFREGAVTAAELREEFLDVAHAIDSGLDPGLAGLAIRQQDARKAAEGGTGAMGDEADAADDLAGATDDATSALQRYADNQLAATSPTFALIEAQERATGALGDYNEAVEEHGAESIEAQAAAVRLAEAELRVGAAASEAEGSFDGANDVLRDMVDSGRLTAAQADKVRDAIGSARGEAERYAGDYMARLLARLSIEAVDVSSGQRVSVGQIGFRHSGGVIGRGDPGRLPGLRSDERVTALEVGEEVLTEDDPRHRDNLTGRTITPTGTRSSTVNYNITVHAPNYVGAPQELLSEVKRLLARDARNGGRLVAQVVSP